MNRFLTQLSLTLLIGAFVSPALNAQDVTGPEGSKIYVTVSQNREIAGTPIELTESKSQQVSAKSQFLLRRSTESRCTLTRPIQP